MFERGKDGPHASFRKREAELLRRLIADYVSLLDAESYGGDPVLARLFPSASLDDDRVAKSFRELTEDDLAAQKRKNAQKALESLGESGRWEGPVSQEQQEAWLALLTDLRLVIGVQEGITEETMEMRIDPFNPSHSRLLLMHYLGALQEELVQSVQGAV